MKKNMMINLTIIPFIYKKANMMLYVMKIV